MAKKSIPEDVKEQIEAIIKNINETVIQNADYFFVPRYKSKFVYLERKDNYGISARGRLTYARDMNGWEFAIYKYSSNYYSPEEWFFPSSNYVNGTIEGALKTCL